MTKIRSKVAKILLYVTYPLLIFALIVTGTLLFLENRKYNQLNDSFTAARESLNKENEDKQITINDISEEFQEQRDTIEALRSENDLLNQQIESITRSTNGKISGSIFPFITADSSNFVQYQLVCAESVTNKNIIVCSSVSTISQKYELSVPAGEYQVYATIHPAPAEESVLFGKKAYYTEYVQCVGENGAAKCNANKNDPIRVLVESGKNVSDVDPIGWQ